MNVQRVSVRQQEGGARKTRDEIVLENLPLVKAIAIRVYENLPVHVELDDLVHAGVLGLFDAVEKFDASKNVEFHSYAKHRVKGAILDSLRQMDWASRDMRKRQKQVESVTRDLSDKLGRVPTQDEIAHGMGVTADRFRRMTLELQTVALVSTTRDSEEREREQEFAAASDVRPDHICERKQLQCTLQRAIGGLPERYRKVVFMYYTNHMTMKEIGDKMGVNESRVSQIHKLALKKMAVALESEGICSAAAL